jgi:hypothetical protein
MAVSVSAIGLVFSGSLNVIIGGGSLVMVSLMEPAASGGVQLHRCMSMPVEGVVVVLFITTHSGGMPLPDPRLICSLAFCTRPVGQPQDSTRG